MARPLQSAVLYILVRFRHRILPAALRVAPHDSFAATTGALGPG